MKSFILVVLVIILAGNLLAQEKMQDVVYLKNERIVQGAIVEVIPNTSIEIRKRDGEIYELTPLFVKRTLLLPISFSEQEEKKEEFVPKTYVSGGAIFYKDKSEEVDKRYGWIHGARGSVAKDFSKNLRGEVGLSLLNDEGDIEGANGKSKLDIKTISCLGYYVEPSKNGDTAWYIGAGLVITQLKESGTAFYFGEKHEESISGKSSGFKIVLGVEIGRNDKSIGYTQISGLSVSGDFDLEMTLLEFGFRYDLSKK